MKGEIATALKRFEDRVQATMDSDLEGEDATRALYSGFDLDVDEATRINFRTSEVRMHAASLGVPIRGLFGAAWSEGLITGLLIAEQRAKAAVGK